MAPGFGWFLYVFLIPFWGLFPRAFIPSSVANPILFLYLIGFPIAIYVGWTVLGDQVEGRDLAVRLVSFAAGLILGAGLLGLFFGLPVALVTGAVYATWTRGNVVKRRDLYLWIAFAVSVVVSALPWLGLFGVALLPGSIILLARDKPPEFRSFTNNNCTLGRVLLFPCGAVFLWILAPPLDAPGRSFLTCHRRTGIGNLLPKRSSPSC